MCIGRFCIGLGVGSASMIVPLYIAEISPARFRGRMISVDMIFLGTGSVLAYAFDAAFYKVPHGWRYMIGIGAIPSIVLGVLLFWCPESPRQLMYHGRREQCERIIRRIYPNASEQQVQEKLLSIEHGVNAAKSLNEEISLRKSMNMLFAIPANRRAGIAACGLMFFQQFCGFNTLMCNYRLPVKTCARSILTDFPRLFFDTLRHCRILQPHRSRQRSSGSKLGLHRPQHLHHRPRRASSTSSVDNVGNASLPHHGSHRIHLGTDRPQNARADFGRGRMARVPCARGHDPVRGILRSGTGLRAVASQRVLADGGPRDGDHHDQRVQLGPQHCGLGHVPHYDEAHDAFGDFWLLRGALCSRLDLRVLLLPGSFADDA